MAWLDHLAALQKSGREILNCGIPLKKAKEKKDAKTQKKAAESKLKLETDRESKESRERIKTAFHKILQEANTALLEDIKKKIIGIAAAPKHASEAINKIDQRILPTGYAGALTIRAIKSSIPDLEN